VAVIDTVILYAPVMNSLYTLYIPPEIVEKHYIRTYVEQPAHEALTTRLGGSAEGVRARLAHQIAFYIAPRLKLHTERANYNSVYRSTAEIFVFTHEELAAILEARYIRMEPLPLP
jgi:hypothetical protein